MSSAPPRGPVHPENGRRRRSCPIQRMRQAGSVRGVGRPRGLEVLPFPSSRRAVTAAVRAGRRIVPMHGLLDVDITEARRQLADHDPPLSTTAFVIAAVARTAAVHPEVHAYRNWRGQLVRHRHVDVQTIVEVPTEQGPFGLVHVVRDADIRGVADISTELRGVKADLTSTGTGRALQRLAPLAGHIPGLFPRDVCRGRGRPGGEYQNSASTETRLSAMTSPPVPPGTRSRRATLSARSAATLLQAWPSMERTRPS
jgi:hypothetical protein